MSDVTGKGASLEELRAAGWSVAVHNDYRLNGEPHTFWLFTHPNGRWIKGEGRTDDEAITQAAALTLPTEPPSAGREGWRLVPVNGSYAQIRAMSESAADSDEGKFSSLGDLLDFSGENALHIVLREAYRAAIAAAPSPEEGEAYSAPLTPPAEPPSAGREDAAWRERAFERVREVVRRAWELCDDTEEVVDGRGLPSYFVDANDWLRLSGAITALEELIPADQQPAHAGHVVTMLAAAVRKAG